MLYTLVYIYGVDSIVYMNKDKKKTLFFSSIGAFIAGLCCFSPLVLFLFGLGSASFASGLADTFYGEYKWYFRAVGFVAFALAFYLWYRKRIKGCDASQKKRERRKMLNLFLLGIIFFIVVYIIWLYVIVEFFGIQAGLWELPEWFRIFNHDEYLDR